MRRKIKKKDLLLMGMMTLFLIVHPFAQGQISYPEVNPEYLHTRITSIGVSIAEEQNDNCGCSNLPAVMFQLSLRYELWNAGRDIASFTTGVSNDLKDIIPLAYSWDTLHSEEIDFHRNYLIAFMDAEKTHEYPPGITNGTARFYLNVTDWTSETLPLGNYTFQVGPSTWQERLPATLHVESNQTWTEIADLPEGWGIEGVEANIPGYNPWMLGAGLVAVVGLWGWKRIRITSVLIIKGEKQ